jgi:4-amino-4-deoxy-L-arabinose transferase-like glycosyltransferase
MAKKKEGRRTEKKQEIIGECDLDGGFESPVKTFRDISLKNIQSLIVKSRYFQALIVVTLIGIFLRFYDLGYNSIWLDEATTYFTSIKSLADIWQATTAGEFSPPHFMWGEHFMLMLGNNETILRFIPAVLGVLTIPLFYVIGKEFLDRNAGIIAATACAVSPFLIYYSQEARAYSMMLFFLALATIFLLKAIKSGNLIHWALFAIFSALAFWSHFYAIVMIMALVFFAFVELAPGIRTDLKNMKMLILGIAFFVILSLPLLLLSVQLFASRTASAPTYGIQGLGIIVETFYEISGSNDLAMFFLVALFIIGIVQAFIINKNKAAFLVLITVITVIVSYFLSFKMPELPRYLIFLSIVFFIGIAVSYMFFYSLWGSKAVVYGFIILLFIVSAPMLSAYYSGYSKPDWRGFSESLQEKVSPGDTVVSIPGYISQPLDYYFSSVKSDIREYGATTSQDLEKIYSQKGNGTMYFVVTDDISAADPNGDAVAWLKNNTNFVGQDTGIYLFTSN